MPIRRVILLCILGFSVPIGLVLFLAPFMFNHQAEFDQYARSSLRNPDFATSTLEREAVPEELPPAELERTSFREVASSSELDPAVGSVFFVSSKIRFSKLPDIGHRERLFYKYSISEQPHSGWALALRRWPGSMRPEVYWRDATGRGGWYAFGEVNIEEGKWYTFTFVVESASALSLYVSEEEQSVLSTGFVGGISVQQVALPTSQDPLFLAPLIRPDSRGAHPVEASEFLVAQLDQRGLERVRRRLLAAKVPITEAIEDSELRILVKPNNRSDALAS